MQQKRAQLPSSPSAAAAASEPVGFNPTEY